MKKFLLGSAALITLGMASQASAADLGRPYTKAPSPMAAIYDWTGFYIGGHVGGVSARSTVTDVGTAGGVAFAGASIAGAQTRVRSDGVFGGGTIGYNWQVGSGFVFGIEADGGYMGIDRSVALAGTVSGTTVGLRDVAYGDVTGRLGYSWGPGLLYVKGGYAVMEDPRRFATTSAAFLGVTSRDAVSGYTVGGGLEYMFAPNWSAKVEYLHFDFRNDASYTVAATGGTFPFRQSLDLDTVKVGVNYRWGGPVVARY